jgi:hypothetical protein
MRVPAAIICVLVTAGAFAFLHTGSRASALCARGAAVADGFSVWPPGVRCSGGEPVQTKITFDATVLFVIPSVALLAFGGAAIARPAQRKPGQARRA